MISFRHCIGVGVVPSCFVFAVSLLKCMPVLLGYRRFLVGSVLMLI